MKILAPGNLAPRNSAPGNLAPENLAPSSLAPDNLAPGNLEPDPLAPDNLTPCEIFYNLVTQYKNIRSCNIGVSVYIAMSSPTA